MSDGDLTGQHIVLPAPVAEELAVQGTGGSVRPKGFAMHIGVDTVDGDRYGGWPGRLQSSVADAKAMDELSTSLGYSAQTLTNEEATAAAVMAALGQIARQCQSGDTVLVTFSGHGGQVPYTDDRPGGAADTWVLYDRMVLDDEIRGMFAGFPAGARIVVVSDCCHSGSDDDIGGGGAPPPDAQNRPRLIDPAASTANLEASRAVFDAVDSLAYAHDPVTAEALLLAACQDDEEAWENDAHGVFTAALLDSWSAGQYDTYDTLLAAVTGRMPVDVPGQAQHPQIHFYGGPGTDDLRDSRPFTLVGTVGPPPLATVNGFDFSITVHGSHPPTSVTVTFQA